jgi:uncharacterized protein YkvS
MRYYSYIISDDDIEITKLVYSEKEILDEFWLHWATEMKGNGYGDLISREACIDDWCTMHWAQREDVYRFKNGYQGKDFVINEFNFQDPTFNLATVVCLNDNSVVIDRYVNLSLEMERADVLE